MESLIGKTVKSKSSEISFIVDRETDEAVYSSVDSGGVGLWMRHGEYEVV